MRTSNVRGHARGLAVAMALTAATVLPAGQAKAQAAFTVDDVFEVATVQTRALSPDGRWVIATTEDLRGRLGTRSHRTGDPTYVIPRLSRVWQVDTRDGSRVDLFGEPVQVAGVRMSPSGDQVALTVLRGERFRLALVETGSGQVTWPQVPEDVRLAGEQGQSPGWIDDATLALPVRAPSWATDAAAEFARLTQGPITVYRGDDPFLAWEALRRRSADLGVVAFDVRDGSMRELLSATTLGRDGFAVAAGSLVVSADVTQKTSYDVIFGTEAELRVMPIAEAGGDAADVGSDGAEGARTLLEIPETRRLQWSEDRRHYAYSDGGDVFAGSIHDDEPRRLTGAEEEASSGDASDPEGEEDDEQRFNVSSVAPTGTAVIATSRAGLWWIDTDSGERTLVIAEPEGEDARELAPSHSVIAWSPDGASVYLQRSSRTEWNRGVVRWDSADERLEPLLSDARLYSGFELSKDGSTFLFQAADGNRPFDLYVADRDFTDVRRVFEANPQLAAKSLGRTELIDYLDVDGDRLHGVLYYPIDHTPGTPVPTIFLVYERFFDDRFNSTVAILNNAGYAVVMPSVDLEIGFPGEAWLKGVTAAANTLIERGIADPERLGVHGTSYGGYATNLLITQTDRFAAAINISGKVDMISFYTDSPRLGVRNIHAPENSQDRIGATLWEQPQKYIAHSAIMFADRIDTPLLLMTGEQDHNVPARTTLEMYYALRRLGKTVEWVNYVNGGHGMPRTTEAEVRDYYSRIVDWYDRFLRKDEERAATEQGG